MRELCPALLHLRRRGGASVWSVSGFKRFHLYILYTMQTLRWPGRPGHPSFLGPEGRSLTPSPTKSHGHMSPCLGQHLTVSSGPPPPLSPSDTSEPNFPTPCPPCVALTQALHPHPHSLIPLQTPCPTSNPPIFDILLEAGLPTVSFHDPILVSLIQSLSHTTECWGERKPIVLFNEQLLLIYQAM